MSIMDGDNNNMSGDEQGSNSQRNANLARIRDNQRRSRARRKEYLQELEQNWRSCVQSGAEASAEIQAAARKVANENKRLRQLLKQQGLTDAQIDNTQLGSARDVQNPSVLALEGMLSLRRSCGPGSQCDSSDSARRPSSTSTTTPVSTTQDFSMSGVGTLAGAGFPAAHPHAYTTGPSIPSTSAAYDLPYNEIYPWDDQYNTIEPNAIGDSSSCRVAADAIRTFKPDLGEELEQELGCGSGMECSISNTQVFNIMDRYSAGTS